MASRFTFKITKLPGFAVTMYRDGQFERELAFHYGDAAEQAGIDWVFDQEAELRAAIDCHPAGKALPSPSLGRHLRLSEDISDAA